MERRQLRLALPPVLHPPPRDVTANPRGHVLADLDHDEEEEAVDDDHAEEHGKVQPLGPIHVHLEHVLQDVLPRDLGQLVVLVVKHQALQIVLVLPLRDEEYDRFLLLFHMDHAVNFCFMTAKLVRIFTCNAQ
jgi:hypothetical protein